MFGFKRKNKIGQKDHRTEVQINQDKIRVALDSGEVYLKAYNALRRKKDYTNIDEDVLNKIQKLHDENYAGIGNYSFPIDKFENACGEGTVNWDSHVLGWKKNVHPYVRMVLATEGIFVPTLLEMSNILCDKD